MAYKIVITENVQHEIEKILDYLSLQHVGSKTITRILNELELRYNRIAENPGMYPLSENPDLAGAGYHKMPVENYVILYRIDDMHEVVVISGFFHYRQNCLELI